MIDEINALLNEIEDRISVSGHVDGNTLYSWDCTVDSGLYRGLLDVVDDIREILSDYEY